MEGGEVKRMSERYIERKREREKEIYIYIYIERERGGKREKEDIKKQRRENI